MTAATTGTVPRQEIDRRIGALQDHLAGRGIDVAIVLQHVDLSYFAGTVQTCHLLVPQSGTPRLLVRKVLERARADSTLEDIRPLPSLRGLPDEIRALCGPPPWRVGMELDVLPVNLFSVYRDLVGEAEIEDISAAVLKIRSVKSAWEIDRIRDSARVSDLFYREIDECFEAGMSTYELQAILACRACQGGHLGFVHLRGFNVVGLLGTVVSGPSGALPGHSQFAIGGTGPHPFIAHGGDFEPIQRDMPIIFDYNANVSGYHHDQTRLAVWGEMPSEAERCFEALRSILRSLEDQLKPGAVPSALYAQALEEAKSHALEDGFMGMPGCAVPFVGHAVGLEVDEPPVLARGFDEPLVSGNVLAVEPKFRHPEWGVIGIENTYVVREKNGVENLSLSSEDIVRIGM